MMKDKPWPVTNQKQVSTLQSIKQDGRRHVRLPAASFVCQSSLKFSGIVNGGVASDGLLEELSRGPDIHTGEVLRLCPGEQVLDALPRRESVDGVGKTTSA